MSTILIIEDERDLREALQTKFVSEGFIVRTAETSELGLRAVFDKKPDLIFLDVITHSIHAREFLKRLRNLGEGKNNSKVVVFTNLDSDITREEVTEFGIEAYLVKSQVTLEEVTKLARHILG